MTPTIPLALATRLGVLEDGALSEAFGGLVSLHIALT
jgi:hypothetical protein